jgi:chemotaxis protein methyltransferase CheR
VKDRECVAFLQWALPRLDLRWPGYRRVRRQVCRRIARRLGELGCPDLAAYRRRLSEDDDEWRHLDACCRITVSRFHRNAGVWAFLFADVLPGLAQPVDEHGGDAIRAWCIGGASGEEPYTLAIGWRLALASRFPRLHLLVLATEVDPRMIARAKEAIYPPSSLRDLPEAWRDAAFETTDGRYRLRSAFREGVTFEAQDVRARTPQGPFDLILCRNLVFTYFTEDLQRRVLGQLRRRLRSGGALVLGHHERLPEGAERFEPWSARDAVYRG